MFHNPLCLFALFWLSQTWKVKNSITKYFTIENEEYRAEHLIQLGFHFGDNCYHMGLPNQGNKLTVDGFLHNTSHLSRKVPLLLRNDTSYS